MQEISKKILAINIIISQFIIFMITFAIILLLPNPLTLKEIIAFELTYSLLAGVLGGSIILICVQFIFIRIVPKEKLLDEINMMLMEKFTLIELIPIFLVGSAAEELLFRVLIQPYLGILLTSILFTLIHFRYLKKVFVLAEVFILGLILGFVYHATSTIWTPLICHFTVNYVMAILIKKEILQYK